MRDKIGKEVMVITDSTDKLLYIYSGILDRVDGATNIYLVNTRLSIYKIEDDNGLEQLAELSLGYTMIRGSKVKSLSLKE